MKEQVKRQIIEYQMIPPGSRVIVGLSGGGDSVCLLSVLRCLAPELAFSLAALHVHHGIRGEEADEDAAFCARLCDKWDIPFETACVDVPALAAAHGQSPEEAAREARYGRLEEYRRRLGAQRIAVAHHQEDNAETVLWNLLRGAGLRGLSGMRPVNGVLIRPLLETPKAEILCYLEKEGLAWRQDRTNEEDCYTRNRIRRHILGYAAQEINAQAARHICQTASFASEADRFLQAQAARFLARELGREDFSAQTLQKISLPVHTLKREEKILQRYIVREALAACGGLRDLGARQTEAVLALLEDPPGACALRQAALPGGLTARRSYGRLLFEKAGGKETTGSRQPQGEKHAAGYLPEAGAKREGLLQEETVAVLKPGEEAVRIQTGRYVFELRVFPRDKLQKIPTNQYTKWLDYDKIKKSPVFRFRRPGDYFFLADGKKKTVKAYMIDEKIPRPERDAILLAAEGSHVLWIVGRRLCDGVKITEDTKQVLQIIRYGGKEDG